MKLKIYGAPWCGDFVILKYWLDDNKIPYDYINIDENSDASAFVVSINPNGYRSIPVVEFEDGTYLIEPTIPELELKLK